MLILFDVVLPIFLVAGCGFLLARFARLHTTALTPVVIYLLGPALIFRSLYESVVQWEDVVLIAGFVVVLQICLLLISRLLGRVLRWDSETRAVGSLTLTFANCGTYALPVLLFAYGEKGFAFGIIFLLTSSFMQATVGVGIASWQEGIRVSSWIGRIARVPWIYALLAAMLVRIANWQMPLGLYRAIELLASATIPVELVLLGMQLSRVPLRTMGREAVWLTAMKLLLPPFLAWGISTALGATGLLQAVLIVQASMPSAINSLILSMHFRRKPELAAAVVFATTILSIGTLTAILSFLR